MIESEVEMLVLNFEFLGQWTWHALDVLASSKLGYQTIHLRVLAPQTFFPRSDLDRHCSVVWREGERREAWAVVAGPRVPAVYWK